jgi:hypothetical protein
MVFETILFVLTNNPDFNTIDEITLIHRAIKLVSKFENPIKSDTLAEVIWRSIQSSSNMEKSWIHSVGKDNMKHVCHLILHLQNKKEGRPSYKCKFPCISR